MNVHEHTLCRDPHPTHGDPRWRGAHCEECGEPIRVAYPEAEAETPDRITERPDGTLVNESAIDRYLKAAHR